MKILKRFFIRKNSSLGMVIPYFLTEYKWHNTPHVYHYYYSIKSWKQLTQRTKQNITITYTAKLLDSIDREIIDFTYQNIYVHNFYSRATPTLPLICTQCISIYEYFIHNIVGAYFINNDDIKQVHLQWRIYDRIKCA